MYFTRSIIFHVHAWHVCGVAPESLLVPNVHADAVFFRRGSLSICRDTCQKTEKESDECRWFHIGIPFAEAAVPASPAVAAVATTFHFDCKIDSWTVHTSIALLMAMSSRRDSALCRPQPVEAGLSSRNRTDGVRKRADHALAPSLPDQRAVDLAVGDKVRSVALVFVARNECGRIRNRLPDSTTRASVALDGRSAAETVDGLVCPPIRFSTPRLDRRSRHGGQAARSR